MNDSSYLDLMTLENMSGEQRTVIKGNASKYVKLNVGGSLFYTTIGTLTKNDHMLRAMFSGRMEVLTDSEGWVLVDRCGKHFGSILNYLRDGTVALPKTKRELLELETEAKYYLIQDLTALIETELKKRDDVEPICKVPLITSQREEQILLQSTTKPVVKFLCNRRNNKYSYTSNSDDNMLRNVELFDKYSLLYNNRILFIKDVIGKNEICCWSYYGHGNKISEVCCTSIVYGTDKKQTKVEYPEARIYEELLNVLLYENRETGPNLELMQATKGQSGAAYNSDDEGDERLDRIERLRRK